MQTFALDTEPARLCHWILADCTFWTGRLGYGVNLRRASVGVGFGVREQFSRFCKSSFRLAIRFSELPYVDDAS
jgi:hypothetical protein